MLSILIPLYNYNITRLINTVYKQCIDSGIKFEIIIVDDCSNEKFNQEFTNKDNILLVRNNSNIGRTETRQKLASNAQYEWLLFLDADVLPVKEKFIESYINTILSKTCYVCFGGFKYEDEKPNSEKILRWKYGKEKEAIDHNNRNQNPYKVIISANLLIKKRIFLLINKDLKGNYYGYDNIFSLRLKEEKVKAFHIDNPVWHLGLESNNTYLTKKELAAQTILMLYNTNKISSGSNDLLKSFEILKKLWLIKTTSYLFKILKSNLRRNLLSKNPNIFFLNIYRLGYFCEIYTNGK